MSRIVYVIRILARGTQQPDVPAFLDGYDPDASDGIGMAHVTSEPAMALHFETPQEAFQFCLTPSNVKPTHPDGRPNLPLMTLCLALQTYEVPRAH